MYWLQAPLRGIRLRWTRSAQGGSQRNPAEDKGKVNRRACQQKCNGKDKRYKEKSAQRLGQSGDNQTLAAAFFMFPDLLIQRHIAVGKAAEIPIEHTLHLAEILNSILFRDSVPQCDAGDDTAVDFFVDLLKGL